MYDINPILAIDSYKIFHQLFYPKGTTKIACNLTPRNFCYLREYVPEAYFNNKAVVLGLQSSIQEMRDSFDKEFFSKHREEVIQDYHETIRPFIGDNDGTVILNNFRKLHDLGYLPLKFKIVPEGMQVKENVPVMLWYNTHPDFAWLPNYLETFLSSQTWEISTCATIAKVYKNMVDAFAEKTGSPKEFTLVQCHDFSSRGMRGIVDASRSALGHLASFIGSDSISAVGYVNKYYAGKTCVPFVACSVPATEHSCACLGSEEFIADIRAKYRCTEAEAKKISEKEFLRRSIKEFPTGILSFVSDTFDYWNMVTNTVRELKDEIMSRQPDSIGLCKTVIRPDSGCPEDIICGTVREFGKGTTPEEKGSLECLWEIFGGTINAKGYKELDPHIGLIYGDSITPNRCLEILERMEAKGFASCNIVFGVGSYTFAYNTRDTLGFAIKATYGEINGQPVQVYKEPKTDSKKNSAKGMLRVERDEQGELYLVDGLTDDEGGIMETIFENGEMKNLVTFDQIRARLAGSK